MYVIYTKTVSIAGHRRAGVKPRPGPDDKDKLESGNTPHGVKKQECREPKGMDGCQWIVPTLHSVLHPNVVLA